MRGMALTRIGRKLIPIDKKIRKLVLALNEVGLNTHSCCEGHNGNEAWINFLPKNIKEVKMADGFFTIVWKRQEKIKK